MAPPPRTWRLWKRYLILSLSLLGIIAAMLYRVLVPGLPFLMASQKAESTKAPFTIEEYRVHSISGHVVPLRVYRPTGAFNHAVLVLHGVHRLGYDEPRLARFARDLARQGYLVATPDLVDLKSYDLAPSAVDDIEASACFLLDASELQAAALPHQPTVMGISFAGGLGLCAAGRPRLQHRLGAVLAFGGYGDLNRVLNFLITGRLPGGGSLKPHLYGQAVVALRMADRLVPPAEVEPLRAALRLFLQERAEAFPQQVALLPPAAKTVATLCLNWDAEGMESLLRPLALSIHSDPRLSPERNPRPDCPLFFIHGADDNVIPPSETQALGRWAAKGGASTALVTKLIRHVELEDHANTRPALVETYKLARTLTEFMRD